MPSPDRKYGIAVRIPEDAHGIAVKLSQKYGIPMSQMLGTLIDMCSQHDLMKPEWQERLNAALEMGMWQLQKKKHRDSDGKCDGLRAADHKWKCIQGRPNKTPMIRVLAENYDDALDLCGGCTDTLEPILKNYELQDKISQLEDSAKVKANVSFKAPVCNRGGVLNDDGTEFRDCSKSSIRGPVSVEEHCKTLSNGLPCALYAESLISVGKGKVVDLDEQK